MKILAHTFFNRKDRVKSYTQMYKKISFKKSYPANVKRLNIFISLLKKYKPKKIIDAGCGAGLPLIKIKKLGFNINGYDKSKNMVLEAKKNLKINKLNEKLIKEGNFENPLHIKNNSIDCILGMGSFYYSKHFVKTLKIQRKKLKKNGHLIFSLRNKLFDIATLNNYSLKFFSNIYEIKKFDITTKKKFLNLFKGYSERKKFKLKNIDDRNVYSLTHNPLTLQEDFLDKVGLELKGIFFYHYHSLPPVFENIETNKFRKESWKIEDPQDWRGFFIASSFVIDCIKK